MENFAQIIPPAYPYCRLFRQVFPISKISQACLDLVFTLFIQDDIRQIARLLRSIEFQLIHLVGQSFPLRTNMKLMTAQKLLKGSNLVESHKLNKFTRWKNNKLLPQGVRE
uniref:DUF772 domain-containing protein n=1 Tax=Mesocestoides corti TaxID=53468 RepID=A0A5K3G2F2_MESCO